MLLQGFEITMPLEEEEQVRTHNPEIFMPLSREALYWIEIQRIVSLTTLHMVAAQGRCGV